MQIIPLNLDSVLLFLHNSKLAYCASSILVSVVVGHANVLISCPYAFLSRVVRYSLHLQKNIVTSLSLSGSSLLVGT